MGRDRGSVRYHRGGWEIRVQIDGRRVSRRVKAPDTRAGRREAEKALESLITQVGGRTEGITVAQLLELHFLSFGAEWSPSTQRAHRAHIRAVTSEFGEIEVARLTTSKIQQVYGAWAKSGLAASTIHRRHAVLSAALIAAERWEMVPVAATRAVLMPKLPARHFDHLPLMATVTDAIDRIGHRRLQMVARIATATGARRGEIAALRWSDVDLDTGEVRIKTSIAVGEGYLLHRKTPKSGKPRVLAIDSATVARLREWRIQSGQRGPVVPSATDPAAPWHPADITWAWGHYRDRVGLAGLRFHDLRHLHATTLLAAGIPVHTVAARLGHASVKMTLDVYGHAIPAHDRDAANVIARAMS